MIVEENYQLNEEQNGGWDPRVRVVRCGDLVRSFLIVTQRFVVVYDTLLGPLSGRWLRELALEAAEGRPLVVVNSHSDWDHCYGNMCFPEPILGAGECAKRLSGAVGKKELAMKRGEHASYEAVEIKAPSILIADGCVLDGGDLTLQVLGTPGHRPDHLALFIPEISTLFPGDCVEDPIPLVDEDSTQNSQTIRQLKTSLDRMLGLDPRWVLANHAAPQNGVERIRANSDYLCRLQESAAKSSTPLEAENQFPQTSDWPDFYREAHLKQLKFAWEQRPTELALGVESSRAGS